MRRIKIFLASSNELKAEREQFEIEINRKNNVWSKDNLFIQLEIWEGMSARMSVNGSQSEYNKFVNDADLFVLLAYSKVGIYTEEEFTNAFKQFEATQKPFIFTYFKSQPDNADDSLAHFKQKLSDLKHFYSNFTDSNDLWKQFNKELDQFKENGTNDRNTFNAIITRKLIEAIQVNSIPAKKFLENTVADIPDWETKSEYSELAQNIISYSFVGVLGIQLRKLMSIGKDDLTESKQKDYLENCIITAKRALQLICFAYISRLWDYKKDKEFTVTGDTLKILTKFFEASVELNIGDYLHLYKTLFTLFEGLQILPPFAEITNLSESLLDESPFTKACLKLKSIKDLVDKSQADFNTCFEAETELTTVLETLSFLATYKMASIKSIDYDEPRTTKPRFLHKYAVLGIDSKANMNSEKVNYAESPINTDAILLYKGRYVESINLFPFIIDINALTAEEGVKICFYTSQDLNDGSLNYFSLESEKMQNIIFKNTIKSAVDINEIMLDKSKSIALKIDTVITLFQDAKKMILDLSDIED